MTAAEIYDDLIQKIRLYHPSGNLDMVEKAYRLASEAHGDQLRKSGEPYIIHPLSVAVILAELGFDIESVVGGILHDVIEDTHYSFDDVSREFSVEIAQLVDGVTKLDKIEYKKEMDTAERKKLEAQMEEHKERRVREKKLKYEEEREKQREKEEREIRDRIARNEELQAENYRKMFLAMAKDIRVIVIKIADRLHNMRTLKFMRSEKQKEKAQETMDIYAPLAHRLGISKIWYEMEDLSFRYLDPDSYYDLAEKIKRKQSERQAYVKNIVEMLKERLSKTQITASVEGRPKHLFSIYKKMIRKNMTLDQMYDLFAVRVIVDSLSECYEVLGIVHELYKPIQGRFKDYISMPKPNMYQSLHTSLIGPEGEPFELQIRTWEMHRTAEFGIAAHWKYKESPDGKIHPENEEEKLSWLRQILEWQRDMSDNKEYLSELKTELNIFQDQVYCFTPRGEVVILATGSTPIDFAYSIHSAVGNNMIGARVNGNIVSFDQELVTGDRVEIITSRNSKGPKYEWLNMVRTSQARNKINQWFKRINKEENIVRGKELMENDARKKKYDLYELLGKYQDFILRKYNFTEMNQLFATVGHGGIKEGQVVNRLVDEYQKEIDHIKKLEMEKASVEDHALADVIELDVETENRKKNKKSGIVVQGVGDLNVRFSKCCSPVPGDEIVGFVTRGRGVSIHRTDCKNIIYLPVSEKNRLIEASWNIPDNAATTYRAELSIVCEDRMGLIIDISKVFTEYKIPVKNLNARSHNNEAVFNVIVEVSSRDQLDRVCQKIMNIPGIADINRITS
ncbi:MAG: bifunctional (p)ppGpp synthetase/guanosine-3',5'-bis(diphosphate) 3'-pyrophosphohydrolase [Clostridiales bacterium]|jgi:GTP pyrophosphokinase|nr:bifunctional (p)ppGpp synthetase/guanosine-3',5'-bis(diphosphate) 3'-pyrophosphohydrolase [Clostridiales bacterium]